MIFKANDSTSDPSTHVGQLVASIRSLELIHDKTVRLLTSIVTGGIKSSAAIRKCVANAIYESSDCYPSCELCGNYYASWYEDVGVWLCDFCLGLRPDAGLSTLESEQVVQ